MQIGPIFTILNSHLHKINTLDKQIKELKKPEVQSQSYPQDIQIQLEEVKKINGNLQAQIEAITKSTESQLAEIKKKTEEWNVKLQAQLDDMKQNVSISLETPSVNTEKRKYNKKRDKTNGIDL